MYLARKQKNGRSLYFIRESYFNGALWKSRDLFELGEDPSVWIHYPGGAGYFIDERVEEALSSKGIDATQEELEKIFGSFLRPEVKEVIRNFPRRESHGTRRRCSRAQLADVQKSLHEFDKRRLFFLRAGASAPRRMPQQPLRLYNRLLEKSRDEIEQMFEGMESRLPPLERKEYIYRIFDLQHRFSSPLAKDWPQAMDPERMDIFFLEGICRYQEDAGLFPEAMDSGVLHPSLVRYVIMYYDSEFRVPDFERAYIEDFMHRHRTHPKRPRWTPDLTLREACGILDMEEEDFKRFGPRQLARQYRQKALECHPDQGGSHETFIRLTKAYRELLVRKMSSSF